MTGSGPSVMEIVSTGADVTVVVTAAPATAAVSILSTLQVELLMTVPLGSGLPTRTTSWTEPEVPAFRAPGLQVTTPLESVPPPVADTNVTLAGRVSLRTTPEALAVPVLEYASV